jgi:hypothetical protein
MAGAIMPDGLRGSSICARFEAMSGTFSQPSFALEGARTLASATLLGLLLLLRLARR